MRRFRKEHVVIYVACVNVPGCCGERRDRATELHRKVEKEEVKTWQKNVNVSRFLVPPFKGDFAKKKEKKKSKTKQMPSGETTLSHKSTHKDKADAYTPKNTECRFCSQAVFTNGGAAHRPRLDKKRQVQDTRKILEK